MSLRPNCTPCAWAHFPTFVSPGLDQLSLKLSQAAKNRQHQPPMWSCRVSPSIGQRPVPAPAFVALSSTLSKSRVDRASRSSRVTNRRSPWPRAAIALARAFLSVTTPLIFSAKTRSAPAAVSVACCVECLTIGWNTSVADDHFPFSISIMTFAQ